MGPVGMPEIIVIIVALLMLAVPAGIIIAVVLYFNSRSKNRQQPQGPKSIPERLSEIDSLRSQNLITDAEYEEKRRQIMKSI